MDHLIGLDGVLSDIAILRTQTPWRRGRASLVKASETVGTALRAQAVGEIVGIDARLDNRTSASFLFAARRLHNRTVEVQKWWMHGRRSSRR